MKVISARVSEAGNRLVKFLRLGKSDTQEKVQAAPYGIDSNPVKDMIAIYAPTSTKGNEVIIGYLNKNQIADVGEFRTFSTDENGEVKFYIHQKNDGTCEIGGNAKNMVRYQELETAFNSLKSTVDDLTTKYNTHTHILTLTTGTGTAAPTVTQGTAPTADITPAKINELKTL